MLRSTRLLRVLSTSKPTVPPTEAVPELVKQVASQLKKSSQQQEVIKDAQFEFAQVWQKIEQEKGILNMQLPNEIIWLGGAPASGKGTNTQAILAARGITNQPIVLSKLLHQDPKYRSMIDKGEMIKDPLALEALIRALLKCDTNVGVLVDGFPRTEVQVEYLKLLHEKLHQLRNKFFDTEHRDKFRRPIFRIVVLYIDEEESRVRQLKRGKQVRQHNQRIISTGVQEDLIMERATDADTTLIKARYKIFTQHFKALQRLKSLFPFHLINASGTIEDVMRSIWREFEYQSSQELDQQTYDAIQHIPIATQVGIHSRQELVRRLEGYMLTEKDTLKRCVSTIEQIFVPVIRRHSISGRSVIRVDDTQIPGKNDVDILMDVLSERGYSVSVDIRQIAVPVRIEGDKIISDKTKVFVFDVKFPQHVIRGVFGSSEADPTKDLTSDISDIEK